jgi:hypothetical protein
MSLWTDARGRARNLEIADDSAWDVGLGGSREKPVDRIEGAWEEERDGEGKVRIEPTQKAVGETGDWRESVRQGRVKKKSDERGREAPAASAYRKIARKARGERDRIWILRGLPEVVRRGYDRSAVDEEDMARRCDLHDRMAGRDKRPTSQRMAPV